MLQNHANFSQARDFLLHSLRPYYPEGESQSILRLILEDLGIPVYLPISNPHNEVGATIVSKINEIAKEIPAGKPIQYILGYAWFCDLKIGVNPSVLIPRPETEELVELIRKQTFQKPSKMLDLASGSGCIALALKKYFPQAEVTGVEFSHDALETATQNSRNLGLDVQWTWGNLLTGEGLEEGPIYDLIVSNPPYVLEEEKTLMENNVLQFEPPEALFVENHEPLLFYRAIASYAYRKLSKDGSLWLEINERKGEESTTLLMDQGFTQITILKDIHDKDRFIRASR